MVRQTENEKDSITTRSHDMALHHSPSEPQIQDKEENFAALNVTQKIQAQANVLVGAGNNARDVSHPHPPVVVKVNDAQVRIDGRKRIWRHLLRDKKSICRNMIS